MHRCHYEDKIQNTKVSIAATMAFVKLRAAATGIQLINLGSKHWISEAEQK
jgi:hypothetical protein